MKLKELKDFKITTLLKLGLACLLALVMFLGALAWLEADRLWQQTRDLYEHPFQVRPAIARLEFNIESIRRHMKDIVTAKNEYEIGRAHV